MSRSKSSYKKVFWSKYWDTYTEIFIDNGRDRNALELMRWCGRVDKHIPFYYYYSYMDYKRTHSHLYYNRLRGGRASVRDMLRLVTKNGIDDSFDPSRPDYYRGTARYNYRKYYKYF